MTSGFDAMLTLYCEPGLNEHEQYKRGVGCPDNGVRKNKSKPFGQGLFVSLHSRPNTKARSYLQVGWAYKQLVNPQY